MGRGREGLLPARQHTHVARAQEYSAAIMPTEVFPTLEPEPEPAPVGPRGDAARAAGAATRRRSQQPRQGRWQPPQDDATRLKALGDGDTKIPQPPQWMRRCLLECCQPLSRPGPGDWLGRGQPGDTNGDRSGQTFARFCRPGPHRNFPSKHKNTLLLVPIGSPEGAPSPEALVTCLEAHFCMPVELMPPLSKAEEAELEFDEEGCGYGPQLETYSSHGVLFNRLKRLRNGFACVGFTMHDLCNTQSGFGWVFGEAQLDKSVGVFSFARYGSSRTTADFLRRCCMVLTHEVTHLFGVKHCVFAKVNSGASLVEVKPPASRLSA